MKRLFVFSLVCLALMGCSTMEHLPPTCVAKVSQYPATPLPMRQQATRAVLPAPVPAITTVSTAQDECDCKCPSVPPCVATSPKEDGAGSEEPTQETVKPEPPKKPGPTLLLGDSMLYGFTPRWIKRDLHQKLDADRIEIIAMGGEKTQWLRTKLEFKDSYKKGEYFKGWKIAIVNIGGNDLGDRNSVLPLQTTKDNLRIIYEILNKHGVKVFACTVAPSKGNTSGDWALDFEGTEKDRLDLNEWIRKSPLVHHVIDLAAPVDKGGLADNRDGMQDSMAKEVQLWDPAHAKLEVLIEIFRRELAIGMNKTKAAPAAPAETPPPYE